MHTSYFLVIGILLKLPENNLATDVVDQEHFDSLLNEKQFLITLICQQSSNIDEKCSAYDETLSGIKEDLTEVMNNDVDFITLKDSPIADQYLINGQKQPVVMLFRNKVPVLYDGPPDEDAMLESLVRNMEPGVKELTDASFEHLTQAATGATTGDWLVFFQRGSCQICKKMMAVMETVACKYRGRVNVAKVDKETTGVRTGSRFKLDVKSPKPDIILFKLGRMYHFKLEKYDVDTFSSFVTGFYKNYPGESIPLPPTPFDDLVEMSVEYLKIYPLATGICLCLPIVLLIATLFCLLGKGEDNSKNEEDEKKDS